MWSLQALAFFSLALAPAQAALRPNGAGLLWPHLNYRDAWHEPQAAPTLLPRGNDCTPTSKHRFLTNKTEKFLVKSLPEVDFDFGELYSGLIPIDPKNKSEALFFMFAPKVGEPSDDITIWLNGGPGCSSLAGFLQEIGPLRWQPGTFKPVANPYTWTNLTNMLWEIEQPIGTGFSIGTPYATKEEEIAQPFIQWFKEFQKKFGIKNYKVYMTGESYAGRYISYISAAMLDAKDCKYYDLKGALMYDPTIGEYMYASEVAAAPFIEANRNIFRLNDTVMTEIATLHQLCGYKEYIERYLTYPPSGNQPPTFLDMMEMSQNSTCDIFSGAHYLAIHTNPCFNPYTIVDHCPLPWDVLGFPGGLKYTPKGSQIYFQRPNVVKAIHAPKSVKWEPCSSEPVFLGNYSGPQQRNDTSPDPIQHVLPQVIKATNRVLIANGEWDYIIMTNVTLLAIQNMTWNGQLGFQSEPSTDFTVEERDLAYTQQYLDTYNVTVGPQGIIGKSHFERGLMWVETYQAGHMVPVTRPRAAYKQLQWVLGHIDKL